MSEDWFAAAGPELAGADAAWAGGNAGRARVCARRAAGMALKGWLATNPRDAYGTSFMHHLNALADDAAIPVAIREAAARLAARPKPPEGFAAPPPEPLTPMADARLILDWSRAG
jgi:hypothetical protein